MAQTISLVEQAKKAEALDIVLLNKGKRHMDNIRTQLVTFTNNKLLLVEKRKGDLREVRAQITTHIIVEIAMFLGLAAITVFFLRKSLFTPLKLLLASARKVERGKK